MNAANPTTESEDCDEALVALAQGGSSAALEKLFVRHHAWIFNLAIRMVGHAQDAEDVAQEVLAKALASFSSFRGECAFKTWLYRITSNHVINMKKRGREVQFQSLAEYGRAFDQLSGSELPISAGSSVDSELLAEETKITCMTGMLLCLDRLQRLVFALSVLGVHSTDGSSWLGMTAENYRQMLVRARRHLASFMNGRCSLIEPTNPCRCANKTRAAIAAGIVDPEKLQFTSAHVCRIKEVVDRCTDRAEDLMELKVEDLFREHPFQDLPSWVRTVLEDALGEDRR